MTLFNGNATLGHFGLPDLVLPAGIAAADGMGRAGKGQGKTDKSMAGAAAHLNSDFGQGIEKTATIKAAASPSSVRGLTI